MLVSEKEAETKWCPHVSDGGGFATCCGSRCMAWRWLKHPDFAAAWETPVGRCGLSGPAESGK